MRARLQLLMLVPLARLRVDGFLPQEKRVYQGIRDAIRKQQGKLRRLLERLSASESGDGEARDSSGEGEDGRGGEEQSGFWRLDLPLVVQLGPECAAEGGIGAELGAVIESCAKLRGVAAPLRKSKRRAPIKVRPARREACRR